MRKAPLAMPLARFQAKFGQSAIDAEKGIISGVKVMEFGKLARFAGEDGKPLSVTITEKHIDALLAHAGNRAIPSHWSHDWFDKTTDPIHDRIGMLKNFRKDDSGNLVADLHLSPSKHRDTAIWNASNAPDNMMLSAVFGYSKFDKDFIPQSFSACDIVANGAGVTALFKEEPQPETMELKDFIALLKNALADKAEGPTLKTALLSAMDIKTDVEPEAAKLSAMEKDAGVADGDSDDEDKQVPALMRSQLRISRAIGRQMKELKAAQESLKTEKTALLAEVDVRAKAAATGLLGNGSLLNIGSGAPAGDATAKFNAAVDDLEKKGIKRAAAIQATIDAQPELYKEMSQALFRAPARL